MSSKKFYSDVEIKADIILNETPSRALTIGADGKVVSSVVTDAELAHVSGVTSPIQTQLTANADAIAQEILDRQAADEAIEDMIAALPDPMEYKGLYDAATNTPALTNGTGDNGDVYHVTVSGTVDFGAGPISFTAGDKVAYNGATSVYEKWDMTDAVSSVFGRMGAVVAEAGDYTAAQVTNVPAGNLAATDVQGALDELQSDVDTRALQADLEAHIDLATGAHAASAISVVPAGNLVATDVQAALEEIQTSIDTFQVGSAGDIEEMSFPMASGVASPTSIAGFAFAPGVVRSFSALVSVEIDAASDLYEVFTLQGIQRGADFVMSVEGTGDNSLVSFSITSAGQVQYTSGTYPSFSSGLIKFRAIVTTF